ncbi:GDSL-type esterase/lipase family protein [Pedobacter sp. MC2016-14]|uniref:GDSL-type esterase/lipase family protein n=1 Tax=Pedobacter sp. MC2016-14 TaxID=2897327 RepID=UPI001E4DAED5|nr:GDSL-type esterase/lipase family protein [Pedobacter sp. MC2016-14]MCD0489419.1 GDSL-type esterase/lipase family protein [Pedobacter sp. MC2016-14]
MGFKAFALGIALFFFLDSKAQMTPASCPESAQYYAKDSINVVTFGASTVQGVNGLNFQTYLTGNFVRCYSGKTVDITNYGIGGETTGQGLARLDQAIVGKTGFIIISMGVNDALAINDRKLTAKETEANMRQIIQRSLDAGLVPILCTLQFLDDRRDGRLRRTNEIIKQLNSIYISMAKEYKINLADINNFIKRDFTLYQDTVHPNARGYRLIAFVLFDTINKIIAERFLAFTVTQNYPNPAAEITKVDIVLPEAEKVEMKLYNMRGALIKTVLNEYMNTGKHVVEINTSLLTPGIYIYRVITDSGNYSSSKKFIVVH